MTTISEALRHGSRRLAEAGSEEASLETELLLMHALGLDRVRLYQHMRDVLVPQEERDYQDLLQRRLAHEPTAYIVGHKEFYGLDLDVTPAAIIPRPETETLVELVLEFVEARQAERETRVADVGVGCGAIAVALAVHLPRAEIIATDLSPEALALARHNAACHEVSERIRFLEGDLLTPLDDAAHPETKPGVSRDSSRRVDVIAANLPYVRTGDFEAGPPEIRQHEPRLGLDGGPDGLRIIGRLLRQAPARLRPGDALFVEIGEEQGEAARRLATDAFPEARIEVMRDLSGLDRVLVVRL